MTVKLTKVGLEKYRSHPGLLVMQIEESQFLSGLSFKTMRFIGMTNIQWFPTIRACCIDGKSNGDPSFVLL